MPSFDVQNAKAISITEGSVKTIHDSDNTLLWGKVMYNTKYNGDIFQNSYAGKNLLNIPDETVTASGVTSTATNGVINCVGTPTSATFNITNRQQDQSNYAVGTYTLSIKNAPAVGSLQLTFYNRSARRTNFIMPAGERSYTFTTTEAYVRYHLFLTGVTPNTPIDITFEEIQLEVSSSATPYEPYVGGIPSPNPNYPQDINVVTGENTVKVFDNNLWKNYPISLGNTELCKIGNYQDYIWNDGGVWKVHKATGKAELNGTETWTQTSNGKAFFITNIGTIPADQNTMPIIMSNYYTANTYMNVAGTGDTDYGIATHPTDSCITIRNKDITTVADFTTWLSGHNTTVYYGLNNPYDETIMNNTLISQLESIKEWCDRAGYETAVTSVSPNIPIIIDRVAL